MIRCLLSTLLYLLVAGNCHASIARWDGLPAVDVIHLRGPDAGSTVCPMCKYGYDAGVLLFLPSTLVQAAAGEITRALRITTAQINDPRFRTFVIVTGGAPSGALIEALESAHDNWFVAHLPAAQLPAASRDFSIPLHGRAIGHVFAQRRLLWSFDPTDTTAHWESSLYEHADYAMTVLHALYAQASTNPDPDSPKGRLWTAPNRLSSRVTLSADSQSGNNRLCPVTDNGQIRPHALLSITTTTPGQSPRSRWARTDADGCVEIVGARSLGRFDVELFALLSPVATAQINTGELQPGKQAQVTVVAAANHHASGAEIVVGLPCEGCEAVFQGLPPHLHASSRLAAAASGDPLLLSGTVTDGAGVVQPKVIVYAYQTDHDGSYPIDPDLSGAAARHGRLRGWALTDAAGRFRLRTIRPGSYPDSDIPQHIHMHIIEPGRCTYYLGDVMFDDDPHLSAASRKREQQARGGNGIVHARRNGNHWIATRNITLGMNVPGYQACTGTDDRVNESN